MKINIILEDFIANLPYLIDKDRFDVIKTEEENTWIVRKKVEEENIKTKKD